MQMRVDETGHGHKPAPVDLAPAAIAGIGADDAISADGDLELQLYVRNLTDKTYKILTFGTQQGARQTTYGDPRTYGVTLSKKF